MNNEKNLSLISHFQPRTLVLPTDIQARLFRKAAKRQRLQKEVEKTRKKL